ncbi:uncharacterized protein LOC121939969, partial [Plectropomus leopardus]|uniref:uncharacterized protein LOC121939969 n=1 Tax=Plectropomus leopardus TaxID=160734 RepID=UPI001C4D98D7
MALPVHLRDKHPSDQKIHHKSPDSSGPGPGLSCVSFQSDHSVSQPLNFTGGSLFSDHRSKYQQRPDSPGPEPSYVSLKSDWSMDHPVHLRDKHHSDQKIQQQRPDPPRPGPGPSYMLHQSGWSIGEPVYFKEGEHFSDLRGNQKSSEVLHGQSAQQHQTHLDLIFKLLEENIVTFVKNELKNIRRILSPNDPECSNIQTEDEEVLEDEEQRRSSSREAFLKITLNFLRRMKQEELADCLQRRSLVPLCQRKLKSDLRKKF